MPRSTNEAAERYIVERQLAAAEHKRGTRLFDGDRERAARRLAELERGRVDWFAGHLRASMTRVGRNR